VPAAVSVCRRRSLCVGLHALLDNTAAARTRGQITVLQTALRSWGRLTTTCRVNEEVTKDYAACQHMTQVHFLPRLCYPCQCHCGLPIVCLLAFPLQYSLWHSWVRLFRHGKSSPSCQCPPASRSNMAIRIEVPKPRMLQPYLADFTCYRVLCCLSLVTVTVAVPLHLEIVSILLFVCPGSLLAFWPQCR
jgi:hypothetical protein